MKASSFPGVPVQSLEAVEKEMAVQSKNKVFQEKVLKVLELCNALVKIINKQVRKHHFFNVNMFHFNFILTNVNAHDLLD